MVTLEDLKARAESTEEIKSLIEQAQKELDLNVPFWAKIVVFLLRFIPGIPAWVITALPVIIAIIDKLPWFERKQARRELIEAAKESVRAKSPEPLKPVFKKVCVGSVCQVVRADDNRLK
jgi:flagellar biosynthesis component FlhA